METAEILKKAVSLYFIFGKYFTLMADIPWLGGKNPVHNGTFYTFQNGSTCELEKGNFICKNDYISVYNVSYNKELKFDFPSELKVIVEKLNFEVSVEIHNHDFVEAKLKAFKNNPSPLAIHCSDGNITFMMNMLMPVSTREKKSYWQKVLSAKEQLIIKVPSKAVLLMKDQGEVEQKLCKNLQLALNSF